MDELLALGVRQLPVVSKGAEWVNGQSLKDVARIAGIDLGDVKHLPQAELVRRIGLVIDGASRFYAQFPEAHLRENVPGRPRSYSDLAWHLFNVVDAFLEHERGIPLVHTAYSRVPDKSATREEILAYGADVKRRFQQWWSSNPNPDWNARADVYYGNVTRHEFLERTTWHSGQHSRQLMWLLKDKFGIDADQPLGPDMWVGLPMPEKVWDDEPNVR